MSTQENSPESRRPQRRAIEYTAAAIAQASHLFVENGYGATSDTSIYKGVASKGWFYATFPEGRRSVAAAIMENSLHTDGLKEHPLVTQMIYDIGILLAYKITVEEEYLAALKLSFDPLASKEIPGPWKGWVAFNAKQLTQAQVNGEIMDHVDTQAQARQIPAYWAGQVQISLAVDGNLLDLHKHMNLTYRNWLGGMVYGKILSQIDFDPQRGEKLYEDYLLGRES